MRNRILTLLLDGAALLLMLLAAPLSRWMMAHLPPCPVAELGFLCPACGSTRCIRALLALDFPGAFAFHPLLCITLAYLAVLLLTANLAFLADLPPAKRWLSKWTDYRIFIAWAIAYGLFGILRNL